MPWYTITDDFDADFGVDEWHGTNAFIREGDQIFRTYFIDSRGDEAMGSTWALPRHHRARPPGGVGGLARGLPADAALPVVAPATTSTTAARDVSDDTTLRMERTFEAPAQAVFDAWTSEEVIRRWWHAEHDWETTEAEVDLRVGGAVRVVMRNPHEDVEYGGGGRYTEIDPPRRLAFTWIWDGDDTRQLIELDFEERTAQYHGPLHPQRPLGRGGGALPRGRLGQGASTTSSVRWPARTRCPPPRRRA